ncbi:MAG TPA: glutathione S-transferase family protein [Candidatus Binatia bacterium]|jgi:glutathione S-transferase
MHIYGSFGPNPRALRIFLSEKRLDIATTEVDLVGGENRRPPYTDRNPGGQLPSLQLDDGSVLAETVAIFEYLEELHRTPALIGTNAKERAETRMWQRRIELRITENIYNGFRFSEGLGLFSGRMRCLPEAAAGLKATAQDSLRWLDALLGSKHFVVDDRFTIVDIILFCALDFGISVGQPLPADCPNLVRWFETLAKRPSIVASLHPASQATGMRG